MIILVFVLVIVAVVTVFSVQNAAPVSVSFLAWHFEASLAVVIILSLLAGVIAGVALMSWVRIVRSLRGKKKTANGRSDMAGTG